MNVGVNGPVTRNEGMYNNYASVKATWSDTMNMDNMRGATFSEGAKGWDLITYAGKPGTVTDFPSDLSKLRTVGHKHVQTLNYHNDFANDIPGTPADDIAAVATGSITLSAGPHTFCTVSDDGSWLYLDGALLVNNGGLHGPRKVCATTSASKGPHTVTVNFFERGGGAVLEVYMDDGLLSPDGKAAVGGLEGSSTPDGVGGFGNTVHTYSGDTFY